MSLAGKCPRGSGSSWRERALEFQALCYALTIEKLQIYKLISRHRVARYELCRSAIFGNRESVPQILEYVVLPDIFFNIKISRTKWINLSEGEPENT